MGLFETKEERVARAKFAIRKGQANISRYIQNCTKTSDKYRGLAKKAVVYGDERQATQYLRTMRYYEEQETRWNRFLLKLEDIALRGEAVGAIGDLMRSVQQVCTVITKDVSLKDVAATTEKVQMSMDRVGQLEDTMGRFMEDLEIPNGDTALSQSELSAEEMSEISPLLDSLRQEVVADTKSGPRTGRVSSAASVPLSGTVDKELERFRELRKDRP